MKTLTISLIFLVLISPLKSYSTVEDVEPADPGEAGHETILGIDSDKDGVRDDVEIFINRSLPDTKNINRSKERIQSKFFAYILQREFANSKNRVVLKKLEEAKQDVMSCLNLSLRSEIFGEMSNSKKRLNLTIEINGLNHGKEVDLKRKCRTYEQIKESIKGI